jgi:cation transport ATPase
VLLLRGAGVSAVLVSDDSARETEHLAEGCGIERWHAEIAPEKRERLVAELREQGRVVAFVSSRPEDAEAQAAADLAVGGGFGIDMTDLDVRRVAALVSLARGTVAGSRWAGPVALVPVAAGAVLTILGADVAVASLADVVRSKEAAGRENDRLQLPVLREWSVAVRARLLFQRPEYPCRDDTMGLVRAHDFVPS